MLNSGSVILSRSLSRVAEIISHSRSSGALFMSHRVVKTWAGAQRAALRVTIAALC
jgi:hypothetical protein